MPPGEVDASVIGAAAGRFHTAHEQIYGYSYRGSQFVEIVNLRVTGVGLIEKPPVPAAEEAAGPPPEPSSEREVAFEGGFLRCAIFRREVLGAGAELSGPAIVEEYGSTTVIRPGQQARVDRFGNLILRPAGR
jgi:N-methylhydantoinase A